MTKSSNPRGGQANEAGSVHRRGVAAVIVVHALAARGLIELGITDAGPHPVSIAFETKHAVDDIEVTLSDGGRVFIQAKRRYGADTVLASAVGQMLAMLDDVTYRDRLVVRPAAPEVTSWSCPARFGNAARVECSPCPIRRR